MKSPPLLVSFASVDDYLAALSQELRDLHGAEILQLVKRGYPPVVSSRCLATLFGFSTKFVNALCLQNWKYYRTFKIRKGSKHRIIQAPRVALKVIQKWFGYHLSEVMTFNESICGFVKGRSALFAASKHTNAEWVYSVDIKDYFPTTSREVVISGLVDIGYSEKAAKLMAGLCCYKDNLAQGSPASPVISNIVFKEYDEQLSQIATDNTIRFTRYADDIVFSGQDDFPEGIKQQVYSLFADSCWELSKEKEYFAQLPMRLKVHGLLVHRERPRLTKGYRNRIRAYKHLTEAGKVKDEDLKRITGHIKYAESVDDHEV